MLSPITQKIIFEQQECELLSAIWFERAVLEAKAAAHSPRGSRPWFVRLQERVSRYVAEKPTVETYNPCCAA